MFKGQSLQHHTEHTSEMISVKQESVQPSQFTLYRKRFFHQRTGLIGVLLLSAIILMAIFAPFITPGVTPTTFFTGELHYQFGVFGPSLEHFPARLFGTTDPVDGQTSVLAQVTYGARIILIVTFLSTLVATAIGGTIGALSGFWGGWADGVFMRITDLFYSIPLLPLIVLLIGNVIFAPGTSIGARQLTPLQLTLILSLLGWPPIARLLRANVLVIKNQAYIEAAYAVGIAGRRILLRQIIPNAIAPVIVATVLNMAAFLILEATVDFIGIGLKTSVTWGNTLAQSQGAIGAGNWWWPFFPGLFMALTVLGLSFIGEALRNALDVQT